MTRTSSNTDIVDDEVEVEAIPGLRQWQEQQSGVVQDALRGLGELLNNLPPSTKTLDVFGSFVRAHMGVPLGALITERRELSGVRAVMVGLALDELLDEYRPAVSAVTTHGDGSSPRWDTVDVGSDTYHFPAELAFYSDTVISGVAVVVAIRPANRFGDSSGGELSVCVHPDDRRHAVALIMRITDRAAQLHIFRGRVLHVAVGRTGLEYTVVDTPNVTRADIIAPEDVWAEVDLNVRAVSTLSAQMTNLGLGVRRGVLLAGPPGVGKSAIGAVIAGEMAGSFTIVYCDARAGSSTLRQVFDECVAIGPSVVIIEDVDLIVGRRDSGYSQHALSEFLAALDSHVTAQLLVIATTNDVATLDAAAVRAARFDSIIEVGYPSAEAARAILRALLRDVSGGEVVDLYVIGKALPPNTSGADLREIVRRSVLAGGQISTHNLLAQVSSGRYRPTLPAAGTYL